MSRTARQKGSVRPAAESGKPAGGATRSGAGAAAPQQHPMARILHALGWPDAAFEQPSLVAATWKTGAPGATSARHSSPPGTPSPSSAPSPETPSGRQKIPGTAERPLGASSPSLSSSPSSSSSSLRDRFDVLCLMESGVRQLLIASSRSPALPAYAETLGRYTDADATLGAVLDLARALSSPGEHLLVTDPRTFYLYDIDREEVLMCGEQAYQWEEYLYPLLGHRHGLRQRLASLARRNVVQLAADMRRFVDLAARDLAQLAGRPAAEAHHLALALLASLFLWRLEPRPSGTTVRFFWDRLAPADDDQAGARPDLHAAPRTGGIVGALAGPNLLRAIHTTFARLHRRCSLPLWDLGDENQWFARWCGLVSEEHAARLAALLREFVHLARPKLAAAVLEQALLPDEHLHATTSLELQERAVVDARRLVHDGAVVYRPLEIDVRACGLGWALRHVTAALEYWEAVRDAQAASVARRQALGQELDLFQPTSAGAADSGLIEDPVMATLHDSLRLVGLDAAMRPIAGLLVAATVWEWLWRDDRPARAALPCSFASLSRLLGGNV